MSGGGGNATENSNQAFQNSEGPNGSSIPKMSSARLLYATVFSVDSNKILVDYNCGRLLISVEIYVASAEGYDFVLNFCGGHRKTQKKFHVTLTLAAARGLESRFSAGDRLVCIMAKTELGVEFVERLCKCSDLTFGCGRIASVQPDHCILIAHDNAAIGRIVRVDAMALLANSVPMLQTGDRTFYRVWDFLQVVDVDPSGAVAVSKTDGAIVLLQVSGQRNASHLGVGNTCLFVNTTDVGMQLVPPSSLMPGIVVSASESKVKVQSCSNPDFSVSIRLEDTVFKQILSDFRWILHIGDPVEIILGDNCEVMHLSPLPLAVDSRYSFLQPTTIEVDDNIATTAKQINDVSTTESSYSDYCTPSEGSLSPPNQFMGNLSRQMRLPRYLQPYMSYLPPTTDYPALAEQSQCAPFGQPSPTTIEVDDNIVTIAKQINDVSATESSYSDYCTPSEGSLSPPNQFMGNLSSAIDVGDVGGDAGVDLDVAIVESPGSSYASYEDGTIFSMENLARDGHKPDTEPLPRDDVRQIPESRYLSLACDLINAESHCDRTNHLSAPGNFEAYTGDTAPIQNLGDDQTVPDDPSDVNSVATPASRSTPSDGQINVEPQTEEPFVPDNIVHWQLIANTDKCIASSITIREQGISEVGEFEQHVPMSDHANGLFPHGIITTQPYNADSVRPNPRVTVAASAQSNSIAAGFGLTMSTPSFHLSSSSEPPLTQHGAPITSAAVAYPPPRLQPYMSSLLPRPQCPSRPPAQQQRPAQMMLGVPIVQLQYGSDPPFVPSVASLQQPMTFNTAAPGQLAALQFVCGSGGPAAPAYFVPHGQFVPNQPLASCTSDENNGETIACETRPEPCLGAEVGRENPTTSNQISADGAVASLANSHGTPDEMVFKLPANQGSLCSPPSFADNLDLTRCSSVVQLPPTPAKLQARQNCHLLSCCPDWHLTPDTGLCAPRTFYTVWEFTQDITPTPAVTQSGLKCHTEIASPVLRSAPALDQLSTAKLGSRGRGRMLMEHRKTRYSKITAPLEPDIETDRIDNCSAESIDRCQAASDSGALTDGAQSEIVNWIADQVLMFVRRENDPPFGEDAKTLMRTAKELSQL